MELLVLKTPITELYILIFPALPGKIFGLRKAEIPRIKKLGGENFLFLSKFPNPKISKTR